MSTIVPPSPVPPQPTPLLPRVTIVAPPPALANVAMGAKLDAVVTQIIDAYQIKISTNFGELTLKLPARLPITIGQPLLLQIASSSGNQLPTKAQLLLPDGKPLSGHLPNITNTTTSPGGNPAAETAGGTTAPATVRAAVGAIFPATLIRPVVLGANGIVQAPQAGPQIPGQPSLTPAATPAGQPQPGSAAAQPGAPGTASGATAGAPGQANPSTSQQTVQFPAGSTLSLKIVAVKPPQGPAPSLIPPPPSGPVALAGGASLVGTVSGQSGGGQTVVQTHAGPISLPTAQPLPLGTQLTFEVTSLQSTATGGTSVPTAHATPLSPGDGWPTLTDAIDTLADIAPAAQAHLLQAAIPRADAQLATNILFFLSAIRGGDMKGWLGDGPLRILERQRPELAARLRDDFSNLSRIVKDPDTGDWRQHVVPYLNGADIDRIVMLTRDQGGSADEDDDAPGGSRFVIDLNLSRLGHLQIDGLVGERGKRLDVVIRSDEPLPPAMRQDIRALYDNAVEVTGLQGSVGFQAAPGRFVAVSATKADVGGGSGMVV